MNQYVKFMKKIVLSVALLSLVLASSCSQDETQPIAQPTETSNQVLLDKDPINPQQINAQIDAAIQAKGSFDWREASVHTLWSATQHGQYLLAIGFGADANDFDRAKSPQSAALEQQILSAIATSENKSVAAITVTKDAYLNTIDVLVEKQETVLMLRKMAKIRYIEPADYRYFAYANSENRTESSGGSGCGYEALTLATSDYTTITPNAKASWTLYQHNVPQAWALSTGQGVTVGIVDTGLSPEQSYLNGNFNNGLSSGRSVQKFGTYVDSIWPWSTTTDGPNDQCGHGTSMAAAAVAPRNNAGLPVGVAYNANLVAYRAASNVVLDGSHEQNGVKNAFTALGNNTSVKIISMSMGHIFSVGKISDGVKYAYSKGKLIFCAGGTSTSFTNFVGVIFPASMAEAVAVTGIKEGSGYTRCDDCHSGSKIDFTIVMQRNTGKTVPVLSYYNAQSDYVGGSSVATATTAGIAALVWSRYPGWTRDQVLNRLKQSSNFYPNKNAEFGYGNINALQAVQ